MPGEAHLRARLTLDSNVDEAVRRASQSLTKAATDVEKAQKKIAETIVKGDPLKAIEVQARKEIAAIERLVEKDVRLREEGEKAKEAIIRRHAQRINAILARQERDAEISARAVRDRFGRLEQPLNDLRGVVDGFGIATSTAAGHLAMLVTDSIAAFSSGGPIALGLAAVTGGVYALANAWKEARDEVIEARAAMVRSFEDANDAIEAQIAAVRDEAMRRRRIAAGATPDQLRAEDLVAAAQLELQNAENAVRSVERQIEQAREERRRLMEEAALAAEAGLPPTNAGALAEVTQRISDLELRLNAVRDAARDARNNLEGARLAASELLNAPTAPPAGTPSAPAVPGAAAPAAVPGAHLDPVRMLREAERRQAEELAAQREGVEAFAREQAQVDKEFNALLKQVRADMAQKLAPTKDDSERLAEAGASWAVSFMQSFAQSIKDGDAAGILRSALGFIGNAIATFVGGPAGILGGGIFGVIGGLFEDGGVSFAHHLPQGRNGLAVLPGVNADARPAWLHKNEVVMPERVVNETFGGLPQAALVAAGGPLPASTGARIEVHQHIRAFSPSDVIEAVRQALAPAFPVISQARQSARLFDALSPPRPRYA